MRSETSNKWLEFYKPFFADDDTAEAFVLMVENVSPENPRHAAKIMMHQTQRLISLADDVSSMRRNNETLQLLFLLICAENIAKLADDYNGESRSKPYVRNFFRWFLSPEEQTQLSTGIARHDYQPSTLDEAIDALYAVRCDVVHEGKYWGFHFRDGGGPVLHCEPDVTVSLTISEFRRMVVNGCIRAIQTYPRVRNQATPQPA